MSSSWVRTEYAALLGGFQDAANSNIVPKPKNRSGVFNAMPSRRNLDRQEKGQGFRGINPFIGCATKAKDGGRVASATRCLQWRVSERATDFGRGVIRTGALLGTDIRPPEAYLMVRRLFDRPGTNFYSACQVQFFPVGGG